MKISYQFKQVLKMVAFALLPLFTIKFSIMLGGWSWMASKMMVVVFIVSAVVGIMGVAKAIQNLDKRRGLSHQ